jgi:hypothetical protein
VIPCGGEALGVFGEGLLLPTAVNRSPYSRVPLVSS